MHQNTQEPSRGRTKPGHPTVRSAGQVKIIIESKDNVKPEYFEITGEIVQITGETWSALTKHEVNNESRIIFRSRVSDSGCF